MRFECVKKLGAGVSLVALVLIALVFPSPVRGQLAGANLSGVVTDESGATVASAKVSIKNLATGDVRDVTTNTDGLYSAPNVLPGSYEVTVTAKGFQTTVQKGITLTVGADQALNFGLKIGQLSQTVTVSEAPPAVDTTSSTIGATVEQQTVVELPLNGRDWTQLATLQPGVLSIRAQASTGSTANRGNRGFGDALADSGHRPNENTYRIDGININDYSNGAPGSTLGANLGVDAVQEFNVVTTNYTAEYGRTSGAVINAITKSGTNRFHGSGYFFDRDRAWDARNFYDPKQIPPFLRKQFGGSVGGPIIKGKTFFFADYEGVREGQSLSFSDIVPSQAARMGNLVGGAVVVDPKVAPYLSLWPGANSGENGDTGVFKTGGLKDINENYITAKIDHKFSDNDSLNGSYFFDNAPQTIPDNLNNFTSKIFTRRQMFGITENHIFNPSLANVFRFGFNRVVGLVNTPGSAINKAAGDTSLGILPGLDAPLINVSGIASAGGLGNKSFFGHHYNSFQEYDDLFKTQGKHSFKFGFNAERMQYDVLSKVRQNGNFSFSSLSNFLTNQPLNVLILSPNVRNEVGSRDTLYGGYFQDDFRVRSNLTLNYGVRYEMLTNPSEAHNKFGLLNSFFAPFNAQGCPLPIAQTSIPGCTVPVKSMWQKNPTLHNFDPRIGFSYDPFKDGKTAIRAGFGIFDVLPLPYVYTIGDSLTLPFSLQVSAANLPQGSFPTGVLGLLPFTAANAGSRWVDPTPHRSYSLNWNLNIQRSLTPKVTAQIGYVGSHTLHEAFTTDDSNMVVPTMSSIGLLWPLNGKIADQNAGFIRPIFFDGTSKYNGLLAQVQARGVHGLQTQVAYTWGKCLDDGSGAQLGDPFQNSLTSLMFFTRLNRHGPCDFDIRQNLSINYLYNIPGPKGDTVMARVAGGWQVGGIITASTGVPFTLVQAGDPLGQNSSDPLAYPSIVPGCNPYSTTWRQDATNNSYINPNCFAYPTAPASFAAQCAPVKVGGVTANQFSPDGTQVLCPNILGNAGRNQLVGPNLVNVDFSILKTTHVPKVSETFAVQLRFEFFNILNHANFQAPVDNLSFNGFGVQSGGPFNSVQAGSAGVIDSTTTTSRQIQLGVKIIF
jgi:carboxypeptidase family protein